MTKKSRLPSRILFFVFLSLFAEQVLWAKDTPREFENDCVITCLDGTWSQSPNTGNWNCSSNRVSRSLTCPGFASNSINGFAFVPSGAGVRERWPFTGIRFELRLGYETPAVSDDGDVFRIGSAVSYGAEAGFDFRLGRSVVMGPYATYEFSSVDLCDGGDCLRENGNFGVGLRVGFAASPRTLIYGKLGYARIRFTATSGGISESESDGGVQGALGVNLDLGRNLYGMAEANYADYGRFVGINLQRRHVAAGIGARF
jgi:outer membrane immunogenic protein